MQYKYVPMEEEYADEIINNWHYDGIYSFYNMTADEGNLRIFTERADWKNTIFAILSENDELVGWSSFHMVSKIVWLSLGLKPGLTGIGLGEEFVSESIKFAESHYKLDKQPIKLMVALFNQRAIKVYKRAGFIEIGKIMKKTHIGEIEFLQMEKALTS